MTVVDVLEDATARVSAEFRARASEGEALRTMPPDLVQTAKSAGLFRLAMPRSLGGLELDPVAIVTTIEELCRADGSAGWTVLIGNSTAFFAWLDPGSAQAMLAGASDVVSTSMFAPLGRARRDAAEFVIDGRWPFNSGCLHAEWYQAAVMVMDGDRPALRPDGRPDMRFAFITRDQAEIIDTWHSMGLRGTGSHDIEVRGLRLPDRAHRLAHARSPGAGRRAVAARVLSAARGADERISRSASPAGRSMSLRCWHRRSGAAAARAPSPRTPTCSMRSAEQRRASMPPKHSSPTPSARPGTLQRPATR